MTPCTHTGKCKAFENHTQTYIPAPGTAVASTGEYLAGQYNDMAGWRPLPLMRLQQAHKVLLTDFGCHEWSINGPAPASAVPQIEGSSQNPADNASQSASSNVVQPLTLLPLTLLYSTQTVDSNLDGNTKAQSVPAQRVITAHLMR